MQIGEPVEIIEVEEEPMLPYEGEEIAEDQPELEEVPEEVPEEVGATYDCKAVTHVGMDYGVDGSCTIVFGRWHEGDVYEIFSVRHQPRIYKFSYSAKDLLNVNP